MLKRKISGLEILFKSTLMSECQQTLCASLRQTRAERHISGLTSSTERLTGRCAGLWLASRTRCMTTKTLATSTTAKSSVRHPQTRSTISTAPSSTLAPQEKLSREKSKSLYPQKTQCGLTPSLLLKVSS